MSECERVEGDGSLKGRDIELSVSPKDIRTSPYNLCANRSDRRQSWEGDRWFESTSLRRRVRAAITKIRRRKTERPSPCAERLPYQLYLR
jgi:hypothetical protein